MKGVVRVIVSSIILLVFSLSSNELLAQESRFANTIVKKDSQLKDSLRRVRIDSLKSTRHLRLQSPIFRDTISISGVTAISIIAPGFAQLYNKDYWKIPILYGAVGGLTWFGIEQNKKYTNYKKQYDKAVYDKLPRAETEALQSKMMNYNTYRTLLLGAAAMTYIYFIGDGVLNYPNQATNVKMATTLSTICPGAGQIYNGNYWKVPIVIGAFATMGYIVDFNSRGYNRYKKNYNYLTDNDPNTVDEYNGKYPAETLKNIRDSYRRNRDLSIIITAGVYLLNIVDAHVDAHLKDYDVSDDLTFRVEPTILQLSTLTSGTKQGFGMAMQFKF